MGLCKIRTTGQFALSPATDKSASTSKAGLFVKDSTTGRPMVRQAIDARGGRRSHAGCKVRTPVMKNKPWVIAALAMMGWCGSAIHAEEPAAPTYAQRIAEGKSP